MENYATATWKIVKTGVLIEAVLDVESTKGWLGACVVSVHTSKAAELEQKCYDEADRRAKEAGVRLERLTQITASHMSL